MKKFTHVLLSKALIVICFIWFVSCQQRTTEISSTVDQISKRVGMVIKLRPEYLAEYKVLHADNNSGVRDILTKYGMRNFSIFLHELDSGEFYEFGYYEYVGVDFESDMADMAKENRIIEWLKVCDPMQIPLAGSESWTEMIPVYYNK